MKKKYISVALILSLLISITGCASKPEDENLPPVEQEPTGISVEVMKTVNSNIENIKSYSGKIAAIDTADVMSTIQGKVSSVNFEVGDRVHAGDVLFTMNTEDIQNNINVLNAGLNAIEAQIKSAQTTLDTVNGASMQSQIASAKTAMDGAELSYNNTKTTYENNKALYEQGIISKVDFDNIELAYQNAELQYNQAKESYDLIANKMPEENLRKAQDGLNAAIASKDSTLAQIQSAQKSLNDAVVKSPISGIVSQCNVTAGTVLSQGIPFTIINLDTVKTVVNVSEELVNLINVGQEVDVKIPAISDLSLKGTVITVSPAANQSGTYPVEIKISNGDGTLKAGMFAEVSFTKEKSENTIVVPRSSVITKNNEDYVFINEDGKAKKMLVVTGIDSGEDIEIKSGLQVGMDIIIKGQTYLEEGDELILSSGNEINEDTSNENNSSENPSAIKEE